MHDVILKRFEVARIGVPSIGRATYGPGWKWSVHERARRGAPAPEDADPIHGDSPVTRCPLHGDELRENSVPRFPSGLLAANLPERAGADEKGSVGATGTRDRQESLEDGSP